MNIHGIIQVRLGSTRFPNKVLEKINGKTLLELYIERVNHCKLINNGLIIATTENSYEEIYEIFRNKHDIGIFVGSEEDVIDRFYRCAREFNSDIIVRLTPDDPFPDPDVIDFAIKKLVNNPGYDFITNHFNPSFPEGLDIEVYAFSTLARMWKKASLKSEREHLYPYILNHKNEFDIFEFKNELGNYSNLRWTIDHPEDLEMTKEVYKYLYKENEIFKQKDILDLLEKYPEISKINSNIERKEGLKITQKEDLELQQLGY